MTIEEINKELTKVMDLIQSIDFYDIHSWQTKHANQKAVNKAYNRLFNLKEKLERCGGTNE